MWPLDKYVIIWIGVLHCSGLRAHYPKLLQQSRTNSGIGALIHFTHIRNQSEKIVIDVFHDPSFYNHKEDLKA